MLSVLTRRDMSLSRRFFNWADSEGDERSAIIVKSIQKYLQLASSEEGKFHSLFRILTCVLDNATLAENILSSTTIELIELVMKYNRDDSEDFLRTANQFFELADLSLVWSQLKLYLSGTTETYRLTLLKYAIENLRISEQSVIYLFLTDTINGIISAFPVTDFSQIRVWTPPEKLPSAIYWKAIMPYLPSWERR
jgi:hypothetical protein